MKERPILFSAPMVRALLAGTKTQTRRFVKPQPDPEMPPGHFFRSYDGGFMAIEYIDGHYHPWDGVKFKSPYGQPGDRLWVKETWFTPAPDSVKPTELKEGSHIFYAADVTGENISYGSNLRPCLFMRRWMSRITLEITGVRVERLNEIGEADAKAEGAEIQKECDGGQWIICGPRIGSYREGYRWLWEQINGPGSWAANPWVWVVEFRRVKP